MAAASSDMKRGPLQPVLISTLRNSPHVFIYIVQDDVYDHDIRTDCLALSADDHAPPSL